MIPKLILFTYGFCFLTFFFSCDQLSSQRQPEQLVTQSIADTCDNPDADINCCFINIPGNLSNIMTLADNEEPGDRLVILGTIFKTDGKTPYPNVIIYAYHADHTGLYSKRGDETGFQKWHGHLNGWCMTDSNGYYEIHSIRPARYPDNSMPAHIHAAIKTESGQMSYITDFVFKDDSLVNEEYLSTLVNNTGGTGVVDIQKTGNTWTGKRDIIIKK
jgi:protocatechuate 3,4-dioxygenase beta subunit